MTSSITEKHDAKACHKAGESYRNTLTKLKNLVKGIDKCDNYAKSGHDGGDRFPPDWAVPLISYPMTKIREPDDGKFKTSDVPDVTILGGKRVKGCACVKRNGLQGDCELPDCQDNELCLLQPYPLCQPSGNANMSVTPGQAEGIFNHLSPIQNDSRPYECKENEPCNPRCVECNSSLRNICKWNPKFLANGNCGPRSSGVYNGYNNGCTVYQCNPCHPYATWCCPY